MQQEVSLIEWPEGPHSGPRLLGRTDDPKVVRYVRDHLARLRRQELARLEPPVRVVPSDSNPGERS